MPAHEFRYFDAEQLIKFEMILSFNSQVAHLLGFSQLPIEDSESPILDPSPYPTHLTTFSASNDCKSRPTSCNSTNQLQQLAISAFDERYKNQARYVQSASIGPATVGPFRVSASMKLSESTV